MKLTQDLIVFDLEATAALSELGTQEHKNIIQIGAIYLKRTDSHAYEIVDRFDSLVRPVDEIITPFITELTGISNEDVVHAPYFKEVGEKFRQWAAKHGNIKRIRLAAWGTHFDLTLLRKSYEQSGQEYPFVGGGYDIKSWAVLWMMIKNHSEKMGIIEVGDVLGIPFQGRLHNALSDAEHTAKIALKILQDLAQCPV